MSNRCTRVPGILMPKSGTDLFKWPVIACDQYTSQPEYWQETARQVQNAPSTLHLTLPEVYLEDADVEARITNIHQTMQEYLSGGILTELPAGIVLTERHSGGGCPRRGVVISVDLEAYDYAADSSSPVRPTEKTVVERIPPRLKVRDGASIELPHIMLLIDDPERNIIEPLFENTQSFSKLYDTKLMQDGGHITGWFVPQGAQTDALEDKLATLSDPKVFLGKYGLTGEHAPLPYAVGDGNHSMASAKAYWELVKPTLSPEAQQTHPARFALVEIVNIHDESLIIEPIHRVLFGVDAEHLLESAFAFFAKHGARAYVSDKMPQDKTAHVFPYCVKRTRSLLIVENPKWSIPLATLQAFLDAYLSDNQGVKLDYIHGQDVMEQLGSQNGNMGFLLPDIEKNDLFRGVILDGVLPRKTFSMGEAHEKRYYMEAKRITL